MKIIGWIFAGLFAFSFVSNVVAQKQRKLVENLDIQGNRRLTDVELLKLIKTRPGDVFDEKKVQKDLQSLLKTGFFYPQNTRVLTEEGRRGGLSVIFEVRELPLIGKLKYTGLNHFSEEEILAELGKQNVTIEVGKPFNEVKVQKARRIIREYLVKKGYPNAKVEYMYEMRSDTIINLTFVVDEIPNQ